MREAAHRGEHREVAGVAAQATGAVKLSFPLAFHSRTSFCASAIWAEGWVM